MRDGLTALAGLLIVALAAALIGPAFVDWRDWRTDIDRGLAAALGVPVRSEGHVSLRLLPQPRLYLEGISLADGEPSHARIERLTLALAAPPLLKGEIQVTRAIAEGILVTLGYDPQGRFILPRLSEAALTRDTAFDRVTLRGGKLRLAPTAGGAPHDIGPISAEMSALRLAGPWKIDAEAARIPLRISTGAYEPATGLALKIASNTQERRIAIEGAIGLERAGDALTASFAGSGTLALKGEEADAAAPVTLAVKGGLADGRLTAASLSLDLEGVGRLEGEGGWDIVGAGRAEARLAARRLDADALLPLAGVLKSLVSATGGLGLPPFEGTLAIDQINLRGEDVTDLRMRFGFDRTTLRAEGGTTSFAGARVAFSGAYTAATDRTGGSVSLVSDGLQRLALAAQRMGLEPRAADALSSLGALTATLSGSYDAGTLTLDRFSAETRIGRIEGKATLAPKAATFLARVQGLDLALVPELTALWPKALADSDLALDLALEDARISGGQAGRAQLVASRTAGAWRIGGIAASGFGGLELTTVPADATGAVRARLTAPDAAAVLGLGGAALPDELRRWLARRIGLFSPVALDLTVTPTGKPTDWTDFDWQAQGALGRPAGAHAAEAYSVDLAGKVRSAAFLDGKAALEAPAPAMITLFGLPGSAGRATGPWRIETMVSAPDKAGRRATTVTGAGAGFAADWTAQGSAAAGVLLSGPFSARIGNLWSAAPLEAKGQLSWGASGVRLDQARLSTGQTTAEGRLHQATEGHLTGELAFDALDLGTFAFLGWGASDAEPAGWSGRRFGDPPALPAAALALTAGRLTSGAGAIGANWRADAKFDETGLALTGIEGVLAGGKATGALRLGRDGGLRALSFRAALADADAAMLTGNRLSGRLALRLDGGSSGESPARLVASLTGAGQASLADGRLAALSPFALPAALQPGRETEAAADFGKRFVALLVAEDWPLGAASAPLTLSTGVLRFGGVSSATAGARLAMQGALDLRSLQSDIRALLTPDPPPKQATESAAQLTVSWSGPISDPARNLDLSGIGNVFAARQLKRELERIEAFEADGRERAFFARRLRSERERASAEAAAEADARALGEVEAFLTGPAKPSPPPASAAKPAPAPARAGAKPPPSPPLNILPMPAQKPPEEVLSPR